MELIKELNRIQKELVAPKNQYNSFGKYKYRSCEDIIEGVKKVIGDKCILEISDELVMIGERYYVKATATITNEEEKISTTGYARESDTKKGMDPSQITGAASSYARKYALNGLFAIDDTKDADTNAHSSVRATTKKKPIQTTTVSEKATDKQLKMIYAISNSLGKVDEIKKWYKEKYKLNSGKDLTKQQAIEIIKVLQQKQK